MHFVSEASLSIMIEIDSVFLLTNKLWIAFFSFVHVQVFFAFFNFTPNFYVISVRLDERYRKSKKITMTLLKYFSLGQCRHLRTTSNFLVVESETEKYLSKSSQSQVNQMLTTEKF